MGFIYNSVDMRISLPWEKFNKIFLIEKFSRLPVCTIRNFAYLIGTLTSASPGVRYGGLCTKRLGRQKILAHTPKLLRNIKTYEWYSTILQWWSADILTSSITVYFDLENPNRTEQNKRANAGWTAYESNFHINYLELLAGFPLS